MKHGDRRGGGKGGGKVGEGWLGGYGKWDCWRVGELELELVGVCKLRLGLRMGMREWSWKGIKRRRWARRCDDNG